MVQTTLVALAAPKIRPPHLRQVVARERLFERLDEALEAGLGWVEGPAGSGKTTLLASYAQAREKPTVWYTLDPSDQDLGTFFAFFPSAVARIAEAGAEPLPVFVPPALADIGRFASAWGQRLFEALPRSCLLVLDDAQELAGGPLWEAVLCAALTLTDGWAPASPWRSSASERAGCRLGGPARSPIASSSTTCATSSSMS